MPVLTPALIPKPGSNVKKRNAPSAPVVTGWLQERSLQMTIALGVLNVSAFAFKPSTLPVSSTRQGSFGGVVVMEVTPVDRVDVRMPGGVGLAGRAGVGVLVVHPGGTGLVRLGGVLAAGHGGRGGGLAIGLGKQHQVGGLRRPHAW